MNSADTKLVPEEKEYQPDTSEQAMLDAIGSQIQALQSDLQAVLRAICNARKLQGNWTWDGARFVKT